ncbi:MAG: DUF1329 domain-containing protein [Candidatus Binataceae bacterium]
MTKRMFLSAAITLVMLFAMAGFAPAHAEEPIAHEQEATIPAGTVITHQNWRQYKDFMPYGMQVLWSGKYFWKLPPGARIMVGPFHSYPLPEIYLKNTEKYAHLVKIVNLPDGGHSISGYVAGIPFPTPSGPLKGWELLVDDWYAYIPHIACGNHNTFYIRDRFGNTSSETVREVYRHFNHVSDPGAPIMDPKMPGIYETQFAEVLQPEQARYTAILSLYYIEPTQPEDQFLFVPALRRTLRLSLAARCSPFVGTDATQDDVNLGDFNGQFTMFGADYLGEKKVLSIVTAKPGVFGKLSNWYYPAFFPKPEIGQWELRDSDIIDVRRIPSLRKGYCYGRRVIYIDKQALSGNWSDLYDQNMKFWKVLWGAFQVSEVPQVGMQLQGGAFWGDIIDFQNNHESLNMGSDPQGRAFTSNQNCRNVDGINLTDIGKFSSVDGLSEIMR